MDQLLIYTPLSHTHYCYEVGMLKVPAGEVHINGSMVKPEKAAPVTRTTLKTIDPVPADSRQLTHRHAIARPDKLGTDPMAVGGAKKMSAAAESGRNPVSKHKIRPKSGE